MATMVIEQPKPVELEAWREELRVLLGARAFRQAPTLARLLEYLCEKRFAGESNQIKEYSIGVEVFRRGADFDQETDSIVRVEVNRLRKRLAEYYAGEGASHPLRIVIPVGQYVPNFQPVAPAAEAGAVVGPAAQAQELPWFRRRATWVVGLVVAALVLGLEWLAIRAPREHLETPATAPPAQLAAESLIGPPPGDEVRILAGSTRSYVDHADKMWQADAWFAGGTAVKNEVRYVARTQDSIFYRTSREGEFRYDIPLKPGVYELHLHFAETVYGEENTGVGGEGSRLMAVRVNGQPLLSHFDVMADAEETGSRMIGCFLDCRRRRMGGCIWSSPERTGRTRHCRRLRFFRGWGRACGRCGFWRGRLRTTRMTATGGVRTITLRADSWQRTQTR